MATTQEATLGQNYAEYCQERDQMAAQGKAIGTFSSWQFSKGLSNVRIAKTWEEHKRVGIQYGD